ncbi:MAG: hypothetical protein ACI8RA_002202 [Chlamydiales bacterium]|jgi:hypothetical protein
MIDAKKVCINENLDMLVVPKAAILFLSDKLRNRYSMIVEKKLDIETDRETCKLFNNDSPNIAETIRQLAVFIQKTGYKDVEFRNNPVLKEKTELGQRKIALVDIEDMGNPYSGLFGMAAMHDEVNGKNARNFCDPWSSGLIPLLKKQLNLVAVVTKVAKEADIFLPNAYDHLMNPKAA